MDKMYETDKKLEESINNYFSEYCGITYNEEGKMNSCNPPTVSGLALYLGFADRQSLYDYKNNPIHSCTIKKAISRMEQFAEEQLFSGKTPTGAIFWLKNHRWSDKQELQHTTKDNEGNSIGILNRLSEAYDKAGKDSNI